MGIIRGELEYKVSRVYSEFQTLHSNLQDSLPGMPSLPSNKRLLVFVVKAQELKEPLNKYLQLIVRLPNTAKHPDFIDFLSPAGNQADQKKFKRVYRHSTLPSMPMTELVIRKGLDLAYTVSCTVGEPAEDNTGSKIYSVLEGFEDRESCLQKKLSWAITEEGRDFDKASKLSPTKIEEGSEIVLESGNEESESGDTDKELAKWRLVKEKQSMVPQENKKDTRESLELSLSEDNSARIFEEKHIRKKFEVRITCILPFEEAKLLILGTQTGSLLVYKEDSDSDYRNLYKLHLQQRIKAFKGPLDFIDLQKEEAVLLALGDHNRLAFINLSTGSIMHTFKMPLKNILEFKYQDDFKTAFVTQGNSFLTLVDLSEMANIKTRQFELDKARKSAHKRFDMCPDEGLIFCSDSHSGKLSMLDMDFPYSFESRFSIRSTSSGFANCSQVLFFKKKKEVYCSFKRGFVTVHAVNHDNSVLEFLMAVRLHESEIVFMKRFEENEFIFTSAKDGAMKIWQVEQ